MSWVTAAVLLLAQGSEDTYKMNVTLKPEHKGNDIHWIKRALADYDGIKNIAYDYGSQTDVLQLTLSSDTILSPAQLKEALPDRYSIVKIEVFGLVGTVKQDKSDLTFYLPDADLKADLEKWEAQPAWYEYILKNAKDAEGFRINALVESGPTAPIGGRGGPVRPAPGHRASLKLIVTHAQTWKVKVKPSDVPDVTLRFLVDDIDPKKGKSLEESVRSVKGVTWAEFDADASMLILTVKADTPFKLKEFETVISKKGKVAKVTVEGLIGTVRKDGANFVLKAKGTGTEYLLKPERPTAKFAMSRAERMLEKGAAEVRVTGELIENQEGSTIVVSNVRPLRPSDE